MRHLRLALILLTMGSSTALAQWSPTNPNNSSRFQISAGYNYTRANAPPGGCECFALQGAYLSADFSLKRWLSVEAEVTGQHGNDISTLGQDLTLLTFAGGPKIHRNFGRVEPFAQVLVGGVHGSDSYFPSGTSSSPSASSFAVTAGGGVDYHLTSHFSLRLFNVQYLRSTLPNGTNNEQNELMGETGLVYRFDHFGGDHEKKQPDAPPPGPEAQLALNCSSNVNNLDQGDTLEIVAKSITVPANLDVKYVWTTTVGTIIGTGDQVALDTQGVPAGGYHVMGHATTGSARLLSADCDVPFRIKTPAETIKAPTPMPDSSGPVDPAMDREFHENVPDALFGYDSYEIRPDAQAAVNHAAEYLQRHPKIGVLIGGFADDRGSAEYNLALGVERAEAARKALIAAGVQPERLQIISYGKEVQVCTTEDEMCRQQNRRAAFSMHP